MKQKHLLLAILLSAPLLAAPHAALAWQSDNGDGTYTNPVLYADYPDPDIIRVGGDYYFVTTTFVNSPGLRLLHSKDLVNWEIVTNVVGKLDGNPAYDMKDGATDYRHGFYAASIRHYKGTFYIAITPVGQKTRLYRATDPKGPWKCNVLNEEAFDPGLHIEPDGRAYIFTSGSWDGTLTLMTLNADLTKVVKKEKIYYNKGAEGSHIVKRGDWYYLFNAVPHRLGMTVSRAKALTGPWETRNQIDTNSGGHQGALVDTPDGKWYGFAHHDSGAIGRMTVLSPVYWVDDWPVWGTTEKPMQVPAKAEKPVKGFPPMQPATSDEFDAPTLGTQWAWNHNPDDGRWSLSERPGWLRLKATKAAEFWTARNTLTQKGQGPWSRGEVKLDLSHLKSGDTCGFGALGKFNGHIVIRCGTDGRLTLGMEVVEDLGNTRKTDTRAAGIPLDAKTVYLRTDMDFVATQGTCAYSLDGREWKPLGGEFPLAYDWRTGTFQGEQYAIFCYNSAGSDGAADVDYFHFTDKR